MGCFQHLLPLIVFLALALAFSPLVGRRFTDRTSHD